MKKVEKLDSTEILESGDTETLNLTMGLKFGPENFRFLAEKIFNEIVLMIDGQPHRICEIEYYLNRADHVDQYVHGHNDQKKFGTWYFHRHNNGTYKNGNYKGLDIALGDDQTYAAILIRSIWQIKEKNLIEGPCKTVNHILQLSKKNSILELTQNQSLDCRNCNLPIYLTSAQYSTQYNIYSGPRIGLSDKYPAFKNKPYRYVIGPIKKNRKTLSLIN